MAAARASARCAALRRGVALVLCACASVAAAASRGSIGDLIELRERTEKGVELPLGLDVSSQDVDVNSIVEIVARPQPGGESSTWTKLRDGDVVDVSSRLRKGADAMLAALSDAVDLASLPVDAASKAKRDDASQRLFAAAIGPLKDYRDGLRASRDPALVARAGRLSSRFDAALAPDRHAELAPLYLEEAQWVVDRLEAEIARIRSEPSTRALVLAAYHVGKDGHPVELALRNYNSLIAGPVTEIDKVSLVADEEQIAEMTRLVEEARSWSTFLEGLSARHESLTETIGSVLKHAGLDPAPIEASAERVLASISALGAAPWKERLAQLAAKLAEVAQQATDPALRARVESLRARLAAASEDLARVESEGSALASDVKAIAAAFEAAAEERRDAPADALVGLLGSLGGLGASGGLPARVQRLVDAARGLARDAGGVLDEGHRLADELRDVPQQWAEDVRAEMSSALDGTFAEPRAALAELASQLERYHQGLLRLVAPETLSLAAATDIEVPPASSAPVLVASIKPTEVDLRTIGRRREGDGVVLHAWLYAVESRSGEDAPIELGQQLEHVVQELRLRRFGWYADPSVVVGYVESSQAVESHADQTRQFTPVVSWLLHHRNWRDPSPVAGRSLGAIPGPTAASRPSGAWRASWGAGLHAAFLDLDEDGQQEVGLGITFSLPRDYVQVGYGFDLSLDAEPYWYIGTRVFNLSGKVGASTAPR